MSTRPKMDDYRAVVADFLTVIPAKAGIQTIEAKLAARNQVRIAAGGSLLPSWAYRGRFRNSSYSPVIPAKAGIQTVAAKPSTRNQV